MHFNADNGQYKNRINVKNLLALSNKKHIHDSVKVNMVYI